VPYRGEGPAILDLLSGHVRVMIPTIPPSIEYIRAGKLVPIAVTLGTRSELLPGVPTIGEFVPGCEAGAWVGIGAPRGTPPEIIEKINREVNAALADPQLKARIADQGGTASPGSPAEFGKFIVDFTDKWARVIRAANIKIE
jgi:tripartite-type tricarboxylate transporter receptor subunit TctC